MSTETLTLVSPLDVLSVGFECEDCGATLFVPVAKLTGDLPRKCPNCGQVWLYEPERAIVGATDRQVIGGFVEALTQMRGRPFGSRVRLEIAQPVKEGRQ